MPGNSFHGEHRQQEARLTQGKDRDFTLLYGQGLAFTDVKPVEEEGKRCQHKAGIAQSYRLHEARDVWNEQDAGRARVEVGIDVGGQEGERSPAQQPEAVQRAVVGEQGHNPDEILRAEDLAGGDKDKQDGDTGLRQIELLAPLQEENKSVAKHKRHITHCRYKAIKDAVYIERTIT